MCSENKHSKLFLRELAGSQVRLTGMYCWVKDPIDDRDAEDVDEADYMFH